jgi:hypothetical protein
MASLFHPAFTLAVTFISRHFLPVSHPIINPRIFQNHGRRQKAFPDPDGNTDGEEIPHLLGSCKSQPWIERIPAFADQENCYWQHPPQRNEGRGKNRPDLLSKERILEESKDAAWENSDGAIIHSCRRDKLRRPKRTTEAALSVESVVIGARVK